MDFNLVNQIYLFVPFFYRSLFSQLSHVFGVLVVLDNSQHCELVEEFTNKWVLQMWVVIRSVRLTIAFPVIQEMLDNDLLPHDQLSLHQWYHFDSKDDKLANSCIPLHGNQIPLDMNYGLAYPHCQKPTAHELKKLLSNFMLSAI
jgi:hypothetical protein